MGVVVAVLVYSASRFYFSTGNLAKIGLHEKYNFLLSVKYFFYWIDTELSLSKLHSTLLRVESFKRYFLLDFFLFNLIIHNWWFLVTDQPLNFFTFIYYIYFGIHQISCSTIFETSLAFIFSRKWNHRIDFRPKLQKLLKIEKKYF